jgi:cytochrome c-type biogenesis protein CcmH
MNGRGIRQSPIAWAGLLAIVVVLIVIGAPRRATSGASEDRVYEIASQLKCPACEGESVAGSQIAIADDMRDKIRELARQGRSDDEIYTYFADRYDERVLLNPSGSGLTGVVWIVPVVVGVLGAVGVGALFARARRLRSAAAHEVDPDDLALVDAARAERSASDE